MSINASIFGTVGKDAEVTRVGNQSTPVAKWSVAVNHKRGQQESTTWVSCSMFGARAEKLSTMINKGDRIVVHGDLKTREYNGKTYVECDVTNVDLCGGKRTGATGGTAPAAGNGYDEATYGEKPNNPDDFPF